MSEGGSLVEPLPTKEFKSTIPPHLLGKLSESERYMVETMSKLENETEWLMTVVQGQNKLGIELNRRLVLVEAALGRLDNRVQSLDSSAQSAITQVKVLWDWKQLVSGKWAIVFWVATITIPLLLKVVLDHWLKKGP
jgi:hypothetical protein